MRMELYIPSSSPILSAPFSWSFVEFTFPMKKNLSVGNNCKGKPFFPYTWYMALVIAPDIALDSNGTVKEGTPRYKPKVSKQ